MATTTNIDLDTYLGHDTMVDLAERAWRDFVIDKLRTSSDAERVLSNSAYSIVGKLIEEKHHIDLERVLTEKVGKLLLDEDSLKYVLTKDMREYGDQKVGIVLEMLETIVKTKFKERLEQVAENIVNNIDFKSKKFQKMVTEEVAKIVAKKIQGGN
jgi:hypothetical protein